MGVVAVAENSPAAEAGIKRGDQILAIGGRRIATLDDLEDALRLPAGSRVDMVLRRAEQERRVQLTLAERPAPAEETADDELPVPMPELDELPPPPLPSPQATLGVTVVDVNQESRRSFRFTATQGAVITRVVEGSPAARFGLPLGGVIVAVDGQRIDTSDDLVATIQQYQPGDEVELAYFQGTQLGARRSAWGCGAPPGMRTPQETAPAARQPIDPPLRLGPSGTDRPFLNRLELRLG